jgi:hypothetical protein
MWAKRSREYETRQDPPEKRLRNNIAELFLDNAISADRAASLFADAQLAHADYVADLAPKKGWYKRKKRFPNAHRDLCRRLLKRNPWPPVYYASITVFDQKLQRDAVVQCPFLLPHEIVWAFAQNNTKEKLLDQTGMSRNCLQHLLKVQSQWGLPEALAVGLWIDGVPCNWDRSQSLECISMNFPGLSGANQPLRIPIAVLNKRFLIKGTTYQEMLDIISWSFVWLAAGKFPPRRHDGSDFRRADVWRRKKTNQSLGLHGFLCELRGDWLMLKEVMRIPAWNNLSGCCFKCNVKPDGIRDFSSNASWRLPQNRINHWGFLAKVLEQNQEISTIYKSPGFDTTCIAIDWLHCCDLGVCCDFLGNLFWMLLPFQTGSNVNQRVSSLFMKMRDYYKAECVETRLDNLTELMLRKKQSSSPKLRAKAAEARGLVNFAVQEALASLDPSNVVHQTAQQAALHLQACYNCLSPERFDGEALQRESIQFCTLYGALEIHSQTLGETTWKVKPKFHMFQELCMQHSNPSTHWVYRDEDFGGYLAAVSKRRGGTNSVSKLGSSVLNKFRSKHSLNLK